jgi:hypothetical protein
MIVDNNLFQAEATNAFGTTGAGRVNFGDPIDTKTARDIGTGTPLYVCLLVTTSFVGSGASVEFIVTSDATSTIATDGSSTDVATFGIKVIADLTAGARFFLELPSIDSERWLAVQSRSTGANTTAGAVTVFITEQKPRWRPYPEAVN